MTVQPVTVHPVVVDAALTRARIAGREYAGYTQEQVDEVVRAVGWACYEPGNVAVYAHLSRHTTGMGRSADLFDLHRRRVLGTMADLSGQTTVGVIERGRGLERHAKPLGVIAVVAPATAPATAIATTTLSALKTRNAVIVSAHPSARRVAERIVADIGDALEKSGAPAGLVSLMATGDRESVSELMSRCDFVVATGGAATVSRAYASGTPAVSAGTGNSTIIVDEFADIERAARVIAEGGSFNEGTSCSSESNVLVHRSVYARLLAELSTRAAHVLDPETSDLVEAVIWPRGERARDLVGRSAATIAAAAGIATGARLLILTATRVSVGRPMFTEKLTPVCSVAPYDDFAEAVATVGDILTYSGRGHSCGIHTGDNDRARARVDRLARQLDVSRVMVNQSTMGNAGSPHNGLPFTSVVASGSWGGCSRSENVSWRDFLQTTVVSREFDRGIDDLDDAGMRELFGERAVSSGPVVPMARIHQLTG